MASAKPTPKPEATESPFKIESGIDIPPRPGPGGARSGPSFPFEQLGVGQSFLVPVDVPASIKDAGEREKAFKDEARRASNRISGAVRRYRKLNPSKTFIIRTMKKDGGVRVWRTADEQEQPDTTSAAA